MERLTLDEAIKYTKEIARVNRVEAENYIPTTGPYYNANLECAKQYEQISMWLKELKSYKDAEEQGLLVRLPCKVGDTMFRINKGAKNPIIELTVTQIDITRRSYNLEVIDRDCGELMCFKNDIGKTVFLTREEAEKKLEEIKNGL